MDSRPAEDEAAYQAACARLAEPEPAAPVTWRLFLLLLVVMPAALAMLRPDEGAAVLLLLPVLLLHEAGHRVAMHLLGFRDARLFFLPFADVGLPPSAAPVPVLSRGLALLAGPLPGLALALLLQVSFHPPADTMAGALVGWLVLFNGVNLLALGAFDSGRLLDLFLYRGRLGHAAAVWLVPAAALLGLAWVQATWLPVFVAALLLLAAALHQPALRRGLRAMPAMPATLDQLDDGERRALYAEADEEGPGAAAEMREVHERLAAPAPSDRGWLLLAALHAAGVVLACAAFGLLGHDTAAASEALIEMFDRYQRNGEGWDEVIETWKAAPRGRQERAMKRLSARWMENPGKGLDALLRAQALGRKLGLQ